MLIASCCASNTYLVTLIYGENSRLVNGLLNLSRHAIRFVGYSKVHSPDCVRALTAIAATANHQGTTPTTYLNQ